MSEPLFDHDEYMERMAYYFSIAEEEKSIPLAAIRLNVHSDLIEEAVELHKVGAFKKDKKDG